MILLLTTCLGGPYGGGGAAPRAPLKAVHPREGGGALSGIVDYWDTKVKCEKTSVNEWALQAVIVDFSEDFKDRGMDMNMKERCTSHLACRMTGLQNSKHVGRRRCSERQM